MKPYWYDHNPSLTFFYKTIILLEKSYQFFVDDALVQSNKKATEYNCDNEALLDILKKSDAEDILIQVCAFMSTKQRINLAYRLNKMINAYFKAIYVVRMEKEAYAIIKKISLRLDEEQALLESVISDNKIYDFISDILMYFINKRIKKQWYTLMEDDYHGFHDLRKTKRILKSIVF